MFDKMESSASETQPEKKKVLFKFENKKNKKNMDLTSEHLDYNYIKSCTNESVLERILFALKSQNQESYPVLIKITENRLDVLRKNKDDIPQIDTKKMMELIQKYDKGFFESLDKDVERLKHLQRNKKDVKKVEEKEKEIIDRVGSNASGLHKSFHILKGSIREQMLYKSPSVRSAYSRYTRPTMSTNACNYLDSKEKEEDSEENETLHQKVLLEMRKIHRNNHQQKMQRVVQEVQDREDAASKRKTTYRMKYSRK